MGTAASRRTFLQGIGIAGLGLAGAGLADKGSAAEQKPVAGFEDKGKETADAKKRQPVSDRKVKVGIAGYGRCRFGASFSFQDHPNVEIVGVSDLFPDRCAGLAKACRCKTTYPSLEKMIEDDSIEAVFVATDAPSHADLCAKVLKSGKHVASAVPACFATVEDGEKLLDAVVTTGKKYMMFETSMFRAELYAMRQAYKAGALGRIVYSEGEYYHFGVGVKGFGSYKQWRHGVPPLWYPTHNTAFYIGVSDGTFTDVSCQGFRGPLPENQSGVNQFNNPFDTEVALFGTSEGGMSRQAVSWGMRGAHGERGRVHGEFGSMETAQYHGTKKNLLPSLDRPPLPPGVAAGGHGGSHGRLTDEFVTAILEDRDPLVDIYMALNMTVPGIIAHQSAIKNGELLKVPQYIKPKA